MYDEIFQRIFIDETNLLRLPYVCSNIISIKVVCFDKLPRYTQQWYSDKSAKKIIGERCLGTHRKHDNIKEHKDNDDNKDNNCNHDKYDVNEDKNNIFVHNFIVMDDT